LLIESQPIKGGVTRRGPVVRLAGGPGLGCIIAEGALEPFRKTDVGPVA
jgi:hypothetical protein